MYRRYDHQVGDGTVILPGGDAALVRVDGTTLGLALATDGNSRYAALDARQGAMIAVCEAARNVVATGARPAAVTNCLNFANPEHADVWWDLHDAIDGISDACRALDLPVVSGNVSLYNDTGGTGIDPTIVIGMVGVIDDVARRCTSGFRDEGDLVALVGPVAAELDGSEYQRIASGDQCRARHLGWISTSNDGWTRSSSRQSKQGLLHSAHDCAEGRHRDRPRRVVSAGRHRRLGWDRRGSEDGEGLINGSAGILFGEKSDLDSSSASPGRHLCDCTSWQGGTRSPSAVSAPSEARGSA